MSVVPPMSTSGRIEDAIVLFVVYMVVGPPIGGLIFSFFVFIGSFPDWALRTPRHIGLYAMFSYFFGWEAALITAINAAWSRLRGYEKTFPSIAIVGGLASLFWFWVSGGMGIWRPTPSGYVAFACIGAGSAVGCRYLARRWHTPKQVAA